MSTRILLADDDEDFLEVTAYGLRRAGFAVDGVSSGAEALQAVQNDEPDIALIDVDMPKMSGMEVCEFIRASSQMPVVLIGGRHQETEIIRGFTAGADDYVVKPVGVQHLVVRLQAILRRTNARGSDLSPQRLSIPPLLIDLDSFEATVENKPVQLTRLEFRLLHCLAANFGRVVSTSRLIDFGWGLDGEGDASLLKTHFSHIRRKIAEITDAPLSIRALPGTGYKLQIGVE
jgi:DNA-binding response OmpR family regulator